MNLLKILTELNFFRLPFSPLVVGALIQYSKLLTGDMSVLDKTAVLSLGKVFS